jgi:murein DD-endopeptidase MepM/ murein hydrolase activator NlpD
MSVPSRSSVVFWLFLAGLALVTIARVDVRSRSSAAHAETATPPPVDAADAAVILPLTTANAAPAQEATAPAPTAEATVPPPPEVRSLVADTLGRDGSVYLTLKGHRVPELEIARVGQALTRVFDAQRETRPGDVISMEMDSLGTVHHFEYVSIREPEYPVIIERRGDALQARRDTIQLTERLWAIEVTIEDNLSNAIAAAGEGDALTDFVVDYVFGSVIDFQRDPRRGDRLGLVFERLYMGDRFIRYGPVKLARYQGQVVSHLGVRFEDPTGLAEYYDEDGASLERLFLLKPMEFRRISSRFNRNRFHPILKRNMPHLGTDYAAAPGTDVWATARGVVSSAGWNGGFGKMVEIRHPNGYRTRYAHLSRIHVREGQRVDKRDLIGEVGATGRATGPHLHYELLHNGRHIDPGTVNRGDEVRLLSAAYRANFERHKAYLLGLLDNSRRAPAAVVADAAHRRPTALTSP